MPHDALRPDLLKIYDALADDVAAAGPICDLSGRCCRFKEYDHVLYLSRAEAELLLEQGFPAGTEIDDNGCPFQIHGLCTARERRPLGCRIYFCDPTYVGKGPELSEHYISELKSAHDAAELPWEYRPLHDFLREIEPLPQSVATSSEP